MSAMKLEATVFSRYDGDIDTYFFATDEIDDVIEDTIERANEEYPDTWWGAEIRAFNTEEPVLATIEYQGAEIYYGSEYEDD